MSRNFMQRREKAKMERFMRDVYARVDQIIAVELERIQRVDGIVPTCGSGCSHCCRYKILTSIAEACTLVRYLRREWSKEQILGLQVRTRQWHAWDHSLRNRGPAADSREGTGLPSCDGSCPLMVGDTCGAYAVRPVVCRTHFVSSPALSCRAALNPQSTEDAPAALLSVVKAAGPCSAAIRKRIEKAGMEFSRTQMLLPHWLAAEMGWDFTRSF
jgi:Fe-S-cluster containining protein